LRQYEIRDHLEERKQAEEELQRAHDELDRWWKKRTVALRKLSGRLMRCRTTSGGASRASCTTGWTMAAAAQITSTWF